MCGTITKNLCSLFFEIEDDSHVGQIFWQIVVFIDPPLGRNIECEISVRSRPDDEIQFQILDFVMYEGTITTLSLALINHFSRTILKSCTCWCIIMIFAMLNLFSTSETTSGWRGSLAVVNSQLYFHVRTEPILLPGSVLHLWMHSTKICMVQTCFLMSPSGATKNLLICQTDLCSGLVCVKVVAVLIGLHLPFIKLQKMAVCYSLQSARQDRMIFMYKSKEMYPYTYRWEVGLGLFIPVYGMGYRWCLNALLFSL